jgi:hypothetical protein
MTFDSLADIVSNSLGLVIIIMVCVTMIALFRENFSGNTQEEQDNSVSFKIKGDPVTDEEKLPQSVIADSYKRSIIIFCKYKKFYILNSDRFYLKIYHDLLNDNLEKIFIIDDIKFVIKFKNNKIWDAKFKPVKDGGHLLDNDEFFKKNIKKILRHIDEKNRGFTINNKHQYYYFIVYPDSFTIYNKLKKYLLTKQFNINITLFDTPANDKKSYITLGNGMFSYDWSNYRIQE